MQQRHVLNQMKEADEEEAKRRLSEISTTSTAAKVNQDEAAKDKTKGDAIENLREDERMK